MKKKILMISDNLMKGGKERRMLEMLRYLNDRTDFYVNLVILKDKVEYPEIFNLKKIKLIILKRVIKKDPFVFFKLWRICSEFKPDVVHSWGSMPSIYIFLICYLKRIKFLNGMITNAKCPKYSKNWIRSKITFPFSDVIMSNSWAGIKAYPVKIEKARVIYNGVHLERFDIVVSYEKVKLKYKIKTQFVIGMIGAFHPRKDYKTYLDVAIKICQENSNITFLAIGDGEQLQDYMNIIPYYLCDRILFPGAIQNVEELISIMDIGVLTTNTNVHQEGISNVIIEYMAMFKPVIATDGGGTVEIIENNIEGFLIPSDDKKLLEKKIKYLIANEDQRMIMGKNGHEKIAKMFNIDVMMESIIQLYYELIE